MLCIKAQDLRDMRYITGNSCPRETRLQLGKHTNMCTHMLTHTQNAQPCVIKGSIAVTIHTGHSGSEEIVITIISNGLKSCHGNCGHFPKG